MRFLLSTVFDFEEKYQLISATITVPAPLPLALESQIKEQAQLLYRNLGLTGLARIDFFVTNQGAIYLKRNQHHAGIYWALPLPSYDGGSRVILRNISREIDCTGRGGQTMNTLQLINKTIH